MRGWGERGLRAPGQRCSCSGRPPSFPLRVWLPAHLSHPSDAPPGPLSSVKLRPQGAGLQRGAPPPGVWTPRHHECSLKAPCFRRAGLCSARAQPSLRATRRPSQSLSCKQFLRCGISGKAYNLMGRETGRGPRRAYEAAFRLWGESQLQSSASLEGGVMFLGPGKRWGKPVPPVGSDGREGDRLAAVPTSHPGAREQQAVEGPAHPRGHPPVPVLAGVPSRAGSPGHTPTGHPRVVGKDRGWGGEGVTTDPSQRAPLPRL